MLKLSKHYLNKSKKFQTLSAALVILVIATIGTFLLIGSHASSPYVSITSDHGTLANGAISQTCTGATNGNCVVFKGTGGSGGGTGGSGGTTGGGTALNCLTLNGSENPAITCGYPGSTSDTTPVGASNCSALPTFSFATKPAGTYYSGTGNSLEISASNVTISNMNLGDIGIYVPKGINNFTLDNVCIDNNGGNSIGSQMINVAGGATNTTVKNSTLTGLNNTTGAIGKIINDFGTGSTIENNYMTNMAGGVFEKGGGSETVSNNYMFLNDSTMVGAHYEPMYYSNPTGLAISHNTLINLNNQTAEIFGNTDDGQPPDPTNAPCVNHAIMSNNLLAGSGFDIYTCAHATSVGTSSISITGNRFARCITPPNTHQYGTGLGGGNTCGTVDGAGADSHGYWPYSGYYGAVASVYCSNAANLTWLNNVWDDNNTAVSC